MPVLTKPRGLPFPLFFYLPTTPGLLMVDKGGFQKEQGLRVAAPADLIWKKWGLYQAPSTAGLISHNLLGRKVDCLRFFSGKRGCQLQSVYSLSLNENVPRYALLRLGALKTTPSPSPLKRFSRANAGMAWESLASGV